MPNRLLLCLVAFGLATSFSFDAIAAAPVLPNPAGEVSMDHDAGRLVAARPGPRRDADRPETVVLPEKADGSSAGVLFEVPVGLSERDRRFTLAVKTGSRLLIRETIDLPARLPEGAAIAFLAGHEKELEQLRKMAAGKSTAFQFTMTVGDRTVVDMPFIDADRSTVVAGDSLTVVGVTRSVEVNIRDPLRVQLNAVYPEPQCESGCYDTYVQCYYYDCDQRGDCTYCWTDYQSCANSCPQICEEPRDQYEWRTPWRYKHHEYRFNFCVLNSSSYQLWDEIEERDVFQRTVHCDFTYTDVQIGTEERWAASCKRFHYNGCVGDSSWGAYPSCPF